MQTAAVLEFTTVLQKAPRDWKLSQAALGGRNQSRRALGEGGEDGRQQWLWGRGVRFPGTLPAPSFRLHQRLCCDRAARLLLHRLNTKRIRRLLTL